MMNSKRVLIFVAVVTGGVIVTAVVVGITQLVRRLRKG